MVDDEKIREVAKAAKNQKELHCNLGGLGGVVAELKVLGNKWQALILVPRKAGERELASVSGRWL